MLTASDLKKAMTNGFNSILLKINGGTFDQAGAAEKITAAEAATAEAEIKIAAIEAETKVIEAKLEALETAQRTDTFSAGIEKARAEYRITAADAEMYIKLGEDSPEDKRKAILEEIAARQPNRVLAELSAPGNKIKGTRTFQMRRNAQAIWDSQNPEDVDPEDKKLSLAAFDLMDANENLTFIEAVELVKGDGDGTLQ